MFPVSINVQAPEVNATTWINSPPLSMESLKGRVVLVDFWDYTCVNCIRTLPYVKEWHKRYSKDGLIVIGVHAPEFFFAKDRRNVEQAVKNFDLKYPIALDNDYQTWNAYANHYWPAKYLMDKAGCIRYFHFGEGNYRETEQIIQSLLREINPGLELPPLMEPVRLSDSPGAVCIRPTPELYFGFARGQIGNIEGYHPHQVVTYAPPGAMRPDIIYLEGAWRIENEFVESVSQEFSAAHLLYQGAEVNLVMRLITDEPVSLIIEQDDEPLPKGNRGEDVFENEIGQTVIPVRQPKMYHLLQNQREGYRRASLRVYEPGLQLFAFTFTACVNG